MKESQGIDFSNIDWSYFINPLVLHCSKVI